MGNILVEKLQKNKKKQRIFAIRRLNCGHTDQVRSYCVTLRKKGNQPFEWAVKDFDECLKECVPEGSKVEYVNRMFSVSSDSILYFFCLEAYNKSADSGGCMDDGIPKVFMLHRMSVEQTIHRLKKYSWHSWKKNKPGFPPEEIIDVIKKRMSNPELVERFPNHADRFVAGYYEVKEEYKQKPDYIKGIL